MIHYSPFGLKLVFIKGFFKIRIIVKYQIINSLHLVSSLCNFVTM